MASLGHKILVFGDGASKGNPGPGGWGVIVAGKSRVVELGGGAESSTNNQMELRALLEALQFLNEYALTSDQVHFYWDSQLVLSGAKAWRFGWRKRAWTTSQGEAVKNRELWEAIDAKLDLLKGVSLEFFHVKGHAGIPGNERVDKIASDFAEGGKPELYDGPKSNYPIDLHAQLPSEPFEVQEKRSFETKKAPAYYLSLIAGKLFRDETWAACEARVKGVSGAKYKKVHSPEEEKQVLENWGL